MDDEMDIDVGSTTTFPSSFEGERGQPISTQQPTRLHDQLTSEESTTLSSVMNATSRRYEWHAQLDSTGSSMIRFWTEVVLLLVTALKKTKLRSCIVDVDPMTAAEFLEGFSENESEEWRNGLQKGVKGKDWTDLIDHPKLRTDPVLPGEAMGVPIEFKDAVIKAWKSAFHGKADLALLRAVDRLHSMPVASNYAKIIPITQSSGTGKSKTVDAIAMKRISFPICIRENLGNDAFAYPAADNAIRDLFLGAPSAALEDSCKSYLRSFLRSLFDTVLEQANRFWISEPDATYLKLAAMFYNLFMDTSRRNDFYALVAAKWTSSPVSTTADVEHSFQEACKTLRRCSDWPREGFCPIIISIDEVHVLYAARTQDAASSHSLYSRFRSVVSDLVQYEFCLLVLSTSSIPKIAPSKHAADSLREQSNDRILPAPFTELQFDPHIIADPLVPGKANLGSVGSLEFTAKFGRPLFYSTYIARKDESKESVKKIGMDIMRIVRTKLSGIDRPQSPAVLDASSIAILSSRLHIDLSPTTSMARKYEQDQVRGHLRVIYSVHEDRETMVTGSSPEPLVAEAAADLMHSTVKVDGKDMPYMDVWTLLVQFVEKGLLPQGDIGELIGRALSIFAMDRAIDNTSTKCELKYQTPVTVAEYYKALLTDEAWNVLKDSVPVNRSDLSKESTEKTFEAAFADAYFHFSHYGKANDETPLQDRYGWALWLRGSAVGCQLNQMRSDRALPIFFSSPTNAVSAQTISMAFEQDKTGRTEDPATVAIQSAETLKLFTGGRKAPYIAAVHCYALTDHEGITVHPPSSRDLRSHKKDKASPRYQIDFRGLASYRNVTKGMQADIRRMIDGTKNAVFNHHPRSDNLSLLRQMLPFYGGDFSAWFGGLDQSLDESMEGPLEDEDTDEEVIAEIAAERAWGRGRQFQIRYKGSNEVSHNWIAGKLIYGTKAFDKWRTNVIN